MLAANCRCYCGADLPCAYSGDCFCPLMALKRLWLQGWSHGAGYGSQGIPVLLFRTPGFGPLTLHCKLASSSSRARGYKLRLYDWARLLEGRSLWDPCSVFVFLAVEEGLDTVLFTLVPSHGPWGS